MNNRFMMSVAALALIAGTGFANAQGTGMGREGSSAWFHHAAERAVIRAVFGRVVRGPGEP